MTSDKDICSRCLSEPYLKEVVRSTAKGFECSFCGRTSKINRISVPFDDIMEIIGAKVFEYYDHAVNELSSDSEDGYFGTTYDTAGTGMDHGARRVEALTATN
jgi:hypothetical protein